MSGLINTLIYGGRVDAGSLKTLYEKGFISYNVFMYSRIYDTYMTYIDMRIERMQAVTNTAEKFKVSERTVYRAIKMMI